MYGTLQTLVDMLESSDADGGASGGETEETIDKIMSLVNKMVDEDESGEIDLAEFTQFMSRMLERHGYDVVCAHGGEDALEAEQVEDRTDQHQHGEVGGQEKQDAHGHDGVPPEELLTPVGQP